MIKTTELSAASRPVQRFELPLNEPTPPTLAAPDLAIAAFSSEGLHTEGLNLDRVEIAEDLTRVGLVVSVWDGMTNDGLLSPKKGVSPPPTGAFFAEHLAAAVDDALSDSKPLVAKLPTFSAISAESCATFNLLAICLCECWPKQDQWLLHERLMAAIERIGARGYENPYLRAHGISTPSLYQPDLAPVIPGTPLPKGFRRTAYRGFFSPQLNEGKLCRDTLRWIKKQTCGDVQNIFPSLFKQSLAEILYGHHVTSAFNRGLENIKAHFSEIYRHYPGVGGGTTGAGLIRLPEQGGFLLFVVGDASALRVDGGRTERYGTFADRKDSSQLPTGYFAGLSYGDFRSKPEVRCPTKMTVKHLTNQEVRDSVFTFLTDGFGTAASFQEIVGDSLANPRAVLDHARRIAESLDKIEHTPDDRTMVTVVGSTLVMDAV